MPFRGAPLLDPSVSRSLRLVVRVLAILALVGVAIAAACRVVDPPAAAAAGFALRVRSEVWREPEVGRARPGFGTPAANRASCSSHWRGFRASDRAIKAGNYEIAEGITLAQLLDKLTQGDVTQSGFTVVEGATFAEFAGALAANPGVVKTVLGEPAAELARRIGIPGTNPEGWFFPDTYFFATGSTDLALLVARAPVDARAARWRVGETRARPAAQGALRAADPGVDRRKGDRPRRATGR